MCISNNLQTADRIVSLSECVMGLLQCRSQSKIASLPSCQVKTAANLKYIPHKFLGLNELKLTSGKLGSHYRLVCAILHQ